MVAWWRSHCLLPRTTLDGAPRREGRASDHARTSQRRELPSQLGHGALLRPRVVAGQPEALLPGTSLTGSRASRQAGARPTRSCRRPPGPACRQTVRLWSSPESPAWATRRCARRRARATPSRSCSAWRSCCHPLDSQGAAQVQRRAAVAPRIGPAHVLLIPGLALARDHHPAAAGEPSIQRHLDAVQRGPLQKLEIDSGVEVTEEAALRAVMRSEDVEVSARDTVGGELDLEAPVALRQCDPRSGDDLVPEGAVSDSVVEVVGEPLGCDRRLRW
jgi:hypothetical protein